MRDARRKIQHDAEKFRIKRERDPTASSAPNFFALVFPFLSLSLSKIRVIRFVFGNRAPQASSRIYIYTHHVLRLSLL